MYFRKSNPQIYSLIHTVDDEYAIHKNLIIAYTTQTSQGAYEVLQIECSKTIASDVTYELQTGDTDKIVPGASQYVNVLCTRITEDLDINKILDTVHEGIFLNNMYSIHFTTYLHFKKKVYPFYLLRNNKSEESFTLFRFEVS